MKTYLGDAVYAELVGDMIRLTTSDGIRDTNTIFLEPEVWAALVEYVARATQPPIIVVSTSTDDGETR